jgi:hypothetical protein
MKFLFALGATLSLLVPATQAADALVAAAPASAPAPATTPAPTPTPTPTADLSAPPEVTASAEASAGTDMCFYAHRPTGDARFTVVGPLKQGKQTFGSVRDLLPRLAAQARADGADAIVDYDAGQHFGFWPWRLVRPIAHGTAIKWSGPAPDCTASGGKWMTRIEVDNVAPEKR